LRATNRLRFFSPAIADIESTAFLPRQRLLTSNQLRFFLASGCGHRIDRVFSSPAVQKVMPTVFIAMSTVAKVAKSRRFSKRLAENSPNTDTVSSFKHGI